MNKYVAPNAELIKFLATDIILASTEVTRPAAPDSEDNENEYNDSANNGQ